VQILEKLSDISVELEKDMNESGWTGRTVTLKYKLDTYQGNRYCAIYSFFINQFVFVVFTRAKSLDNWVSKKEELFSVSLQRLMKEYLLTRCLADR
jgi:DNA polymerase kappa